MLKDLTRQDWLSFLDFDPRRIPPVLVLRGTRNLQSRYGRHRALFDDDELLEHVFVGRHVETDVGHASVYGGPMASQITHVFGALGTRLVIQTGVCGAL